MGFCVPPRPPYVDVFVAFLSPARWSAFALVGALCACGLDEPVTGRPCETDRDCADALRAHYCVNDAPAGVPRVCVPGARPLPDPENRPPVIGTNVVVVRSGDVAEGALLVTDPDRDALTFALVSDPAGLVGLLGLDGARYRYEAGAGVDGVRKDPFRVEVSDGVHTVGFNLLVVVVGVTDDALFSTWTGAASEDFDTGANWDPAGRVPDADIDVLVPVADRPLAGNAQAAVGRLFTTPEVTPSLSRVTVHGDTMFASGRVLGQVELGPAGPAVDIAGAVHSLRVQRDARVVSPVHVSADLRHEAGALDVVQGTTLEVAGDFVQDQARVDVHFLPDEQEPLFAPPTLVVQGRLSLLGNIVGAAGRVLVGTGLAAEHLAPPAGIVFCFVDRDRDIEVRVPAATGAYLHHAIVEPGAQVRVFTSTDVHGDLDLGGTLAPVPGTTTRVLGTLRVRSSARAAAGPTGTVVANRCEVSPFTPVPAYIVCLDDGGLDAGITEPPPAVDAALPDAGIVDASGPDASVPDAGGVDASVLDAGGLDASVPDVSVPDAGGLDAGVVDAAVLDETACHQNGPSPFVRNSVATGWGAGLCAGEVELDPGLAVVPGTYPVMGPGGGQIVFTGGAAYEVERVAASGRAAALVDVEGPAGVQSHCVYLFRAPALTYTTSGDGTSWTSASAWNEPGSPDLSDDAVVAHDLTVSWTASVDHVWVEPGVQLTGFLGGSLRVFSAAHVSAAMGHDVVLETGSAVLSGGFRTVQAETGMSLRANLHTTGNFVLDGNILGEGHVTLGPHRLVVDGNFNTNNISGPLQIDQDPASVLVVGGNFAPGPVTPAPGMTYTIGGDIDAQFDPPLSRLRLTGDVGGWSSPTQSVRVSGVDAVEAVGPAEVRFRSGCTGLQAHLATTVTVDDGVSVVFDEVVLAPGFVDQTGGRLCAVGSCVDETGDAVDDCAALCPGG